MKSGKLEVVQAVPGSMTLSRLVNRFGKNDYGIVTALNDRLLNSLKKSFDADSLVDVKSFGDVVRQVYFQTGIGTHRLASSRQTLSAIGLVCRHLPSESPFDSVADFPGFHESVATLLKELEHYGIFASNLRELAGQVDADLGEKLVSLAYIAEEIAVLAEKANSMSVSAMMHQSMQNYLELDGQEMRLLVFAESEFHPLALEWLQWLVKEGADVQIIYDRHATNGKIFELATRSINALGLEAKTPGEGNLLTNRLFCDGASGAFVGSELEWVEVHKSGDLLSECEWAVRKCLELGNQAKIAIFCRSIERYGPILKATSDQFDLPLEIRQRGPLLTNGFIKFVTLVLRCFASNDVRQLHKPLGMSYVGSGKDPRIEEAHSYSNNQWGRLRELVADNVENFELGDLSGTLFGQSTDPEQIDPLLNGNGDGSQSDFLTSVIRHLLLSREDAIRQDRTPVDWHAWLRNFIETSPVFPKIPESPTHERDQRAFTSMLSHLGQDAVVWRAAECEPISFRQWLDHSLKILEHATVSQPSGGVDREFGIKVVNEPAELYDVDYLLVLGMLEGTFPRRRSEEPILSDAERATLSEKLGGPQLLNSFDEAKGERDLFYRVCCAAQKGLYLSYPASIEDAESESVPAFYLEEVQVAVPSATTHIHLRRDLYPADTELLHPRDFKLKQSSEASFLPAQPNTVTHSKDLVKINLPSLRPHEIKSVLQCGFRATAERIFPRPEFQSDSWARLMRLVRTSALFTVKTPEEARQDFARCLEEFLDYLRPKVPGWEFDMIVHGAEKLIPQLIDREFRARKLWKREGGVTQRLVTFGDPMLSGYRSPVEETVPAITELNGVRTIHLFRMRAPSARNVRNEDKDNHSLALLGEYSPYLLAAWTHGMTPRVEVEGLGSQRTLIVFAGDGGRPPQGDGLEVINLSKIDGSLGELQVEFRAVAQKLKENLPAMELKASPGDYCNFCNYADICRRSKMAPEEDDLFAWGESDVFGGGL